MKGFPEAMQEIFDDSSIMKRNFETPPALHHSWNPVAMRRSWQHFTAFDMWEQSHRIDRGADHDTEESLKGWLSLRIENFIPGKLPNDGAA